MNNGYLPDEGRMNRNFKEMAEQEIRDVS